MKISREELKKFNNKIERIPAFEEKLGVQLENISFAIEGPIFWIYGDFFMDDLATLMKSPQ